ncbi:alpha/beta hydrolase [Lysinibacter cavernae]|uniref:Acetyl esterase n=1 Tax=Lysinibacter cavernae TaxID=1640652 RepID=A0A7X5R335_9MICO|nr:alpha/beta hydrolase [Lysinibacter cavernae]NIH54763.1 acetyl esterase [Lysinibacter cavernae]
MSETAEHTIPQLSEFHPEAAEVVRVLREANAPATRTVPIAELRANYRLSTAANGIPRRELVSVRDVALPTPGHDLPAVPVRVYRGSAQGQQPAPSIVFLHGGGWIMGDRETHDGICRYLADASGGTVVAVEYRLAPEHPYPAPLQDCVHAVRAIVREAEALGVDTSRLVVAGDSAGGNLAAVLALLSAAGDLPQVRAQVLLYPVTDLHGEAEGYRRVTSGVPLVADSMRWFRELYVPEGVSREDEWLVSPLRAPTVADAAPAFVLTVAHDPLAEEGIAYAQKLKDAGVPVEHVHLPGHAHGLFTSGRLMSAAEEQLDAALAFVRQHTS